LLIAADEAGFLDAIPDGAGGFVEVRFNDVMNGGRWLEGIGVAASAVMGLRAREAEGSCY